MTDLSKARVRYRDLELEFEGNDVFVSSEIARFFKSFPSEIPLNQPPHNGSAPHVKELPKNSNGDGPKTAAPVLGENNEALWRQLLEPHVKYRGLWSLKHGVKRDKESVASAA